MRVPHTLEKIIGQLGFYCLFMGMLSAQHQTDTVEIAALKGTALTPGHRTLTIDSLTQQTALGQGLDALLSLQTDIFVKSYGGASLATTTMRGSGASHTALMWNGFNLQSSMNGQSDFALIPAFFLDNVSLQYGGSAALHGSGAVGGAIILGNETSASNGFSLRAMQQIGSFGQQQTGLDVAVGIQKWQYRTRLLYRHADFDFPLPNPERTRQPHAVFTQYGLLQEASFKPNDRQQFRAWVWWQDTDRQLPPTLTQDSSQATQQDNDLRIAIDWEYRGASAIWTVRSAWLRSELVFQDPLADIYSLNNSLSWIGEGEGSWDISTHQSLRLGLHATRQQATADGYGAGLPNRWLTAAFASYRLFWGNDRGTLVVSLRQGFADTQRNPLTPSVSASFRLSPHWHLKGQAGRTFRLPTFNDLYWIPGGNDSLQPERGWHQEVGLYGQWQPSNCRLEGSLSVFNQTVDDWILWRPGPSYWFPENVRSVWSRGLETRATLTTRWQSWQFQAGGFYTFTRSTVTAVSLARDRSLGKQLIYTPLHNGGFHLQARRDRMYIRYSHRLTGQRFTTRDNDPSGILPSYTVARLDIGSEWTLGWGRLSLAGGIHNLWNQPYQVMENRAMPLRNFQLTLSIRPQFTRSKS